MLNDTGVLVLAMLIGNPLLARRQGKNALLWFFLSLPFGPLATIYLIVSMIRADRKNKAAERVDRARRAESAVRVAEIEEKRLAEIEVRRVAEEKRVAEIEKRVVPIASRSQALRRRMSEISREQTELSREQTELLSERAELTRESAELKAGMGRVVEEKRVAEIIARLVQIEKKFAEITEEQNEVLTEHLRILSGVVPEKKVGYANSRFKRPPVDFDEWQKTSQDYILLLSLIDCVAEGRGDSRVAPNFPVKAKEVVFLKIFGHLTNHEGTPYIDFGDAYITNKRIVFDGEKKTSEWVFSQMIDFKALDARETAVFKCTDQPSVKGICLTGQDWFRFQFFLIAAFASAKGPIANLASLVASDCLLYDLQKPLSQE